MADQRSNDESNAGAIENILPAENTQQVPGKTPYVKTLFAVVKYSSTSPRVTRSILGFITKKMFEKEQNNYPLYEVGDGTNHLGELGSYEGVCFEGPYSLSNPEHLKVWLTYIRLYANTLGQAAAKLARKMQSENYTPTAEELMGIALADSLSRRDIAIACELLAKQAGVYNEMAIYKKTEESTARRTIDRMDRASSDE